MQTDAARVASPPAVGSRRFWSWRWEPTAPTGGVEHDRPWDGPS